MTCCSNKPCSSVEDNVKDYYGKQLKDSSSLSTNACCLGSAVPAEHRKILSQIHPEITSKFYGCGSPLPPCIEGCVVLDLGCGTGRDVYLASKLVGSQGNVIGIDMTKEQLDVAKKYKDYHANMFGFSNVEFIESNIQQLPLPDESVDVVISNCVLNLVEEKSQVFNEIFRVLKKGGELYFSDVYCDRRVPDSLQKDSVLWGECLSGALYIEDFRRILLNIGIADFRVMESNAITIENKGIEETLHGINFTSITIRAFKLTLEDKCENYSQKVTYKGGINSCKEFSLDASHKFPVGISIPACGNTADMISKSRYGPHFEVDPRGNHQGLFPGC